MEVFLEAARTHMHKINTDDRTAAYLPSSAIAGKASPISLEAVINNIERPEFTSSEETHALILVIEACLRDPEATLDRGSQLRDSATGLQQWTASAIMPGEAFAVQPEYNLGITNKPEKNEINRSRSMMAAGLRLLSHLQHMVPQSSKNNTHVICCLASFSDKRDPWTSPEAFYEASSLLKEYMKEDLGGPKMFHETITGILLTTIKPFFSKSKNPSITPQGRKAINPLLTKSEPTGFEVEGKPWKFQAPYVVTLFGWVLDQMDATMIEANWPLVIPPLLSLVDDGSTYYKVKGCEFLSRFLRIVPAALLERTGLGEVFQEALMPCLLYLPTLTTEEESLVLLNSVYPTLTTLIRTRYPGHANQKPRIKALDKVFRTGILSGYTHAGEHVKIAELLVQHMERLMNEMGISSVKHLKNVLPLLAGILSHPFATAYPPLLKAALTAMDAIIVQDWPRIAYHRGKILEGLTICWCRIKDENKKSVDMEHLERSIQKTVRLLTIAVKGTVDTQREYQELIDSDAQLKDLLIVS